MENNDNKEKFSFDIRQDVAKGNYSNLSIITHSLSEFVVDFATMLPGMNKPEVTSRILMTPENAKKFLVALQDNISKYESQNGEIRLGSPNLPKNTIPFGFNPNNTPEA